jgi:hypothetical protein
MLMLMLVLMFILMFVLILKYLCWDGNKSASPALSRGEAEGGSRVHERLMRAWL